VIVDFYLMSSPRGTAGRNSIDSSYSRDDYSDNAALIPKESEKVRTPSAAGTLHLAFSYCSDVYSATLCFVSLAFVYSVQNLIAPNMSAIAEMWNFSPEQRDEYLGGQLSLVFYAPGVIFAILFGYLSGMASRRMLFVSLIIVTALPTFLTTFVESFRQLAWARAVTGMGIGGVLPVVYSMVGDWFPAHQRAAATAYVTAACGGGILTGQIVAASLGSFDWRWPFLFFSVPMFICAAFFYWTTEEPKRGQNEEGLSAYRDAGFEYQPETISFSQVATVTTCKTNMLVLLQAFPGNIPWGILLVYLHDFLIVDIEFKPREALVMITILAGAGFVGIVLGGFIAQYAYLRGSKYVALLCASMTVIRTIPAFFIFGWPYMFGTGEEVSRGAFLLILVISGILATMAVPGLGAMLLNVNLPETRGTMCALYSVLEDLSKGVGSYIVTLIAEAVGGRPVAYQICLLLWILPGVAMFEAIKTFETDEEAMRKRLDEMAGEALIRASKNKARSEIGKLSKAAAEAMNRSKPSTRI
jgi:MFS family permease